MNKYTAANGMTFTDEDIDRWCEYYDRGQFPPGEHTVGEVVMGRPPLSHDRKEILEDTKATMAIAGLPLEDEDITVLEDCLTGKTTFDEAIANAIAEFKTAAENEDNESPQD